MYHQFVLRILLSLYWVRACCVSVLFFSIVCFFVPFLCILGVYKKRAIAKIRYTRKPDGQNRVPPATLVPGRQLIGQRPPRPDSGRISNGSTRFWLLTPSATRFQSHLPDYGRAICTLFIFLRAKKIRQLKNKIVIAPPQHDTLRCFLDADSFQGGSFNLSENISDIISFMFYCLNSPQGRRQSCLLWLQWLQCVDRC